MDPHLVPVPSLDGERHLIVLPASVHDNDASSAVLDEAWQWGSTERLEVVLVDRGVTERGAERVGDAAGVEIRRVGRDEPQLDEEGSQVLRPIPYAWRVEADTDASGGPAASPSRSRTRPRRRRDGFRWPACGTCCEDRDEARHWPRRIGPGSIGCRRTPDPSAVATGHARGGRRRRKVMATRFSPRTSTVVMFTVSCTIRLPPR